MPTLTTSLGEVSYTSQGEGEVVVLLHANPGDSRDWDGVLPALARRFRVISLDWPGYGASPAPTPPHAASAFHYAKVLAEVLAHLTVGPVVLIGNSVGGFAAMRVALDQPAKVRGLVLVAPGGFTSHNAFTRAFVKLKGREWFTRLIAGAFARRYLVRRTPWTDAMIARADAERREPARVAVDAAIWRSFLAPDHDLRVAAQRISAPVLFVWGRLDPNVPLHRDGACARAALPAARFVTLETGHAPHAEDPSGFVEGIEPFLASLPCALAT